jgi:hypothetical protein
LASSKFCAVIILRRGKALKSAMQARIFFGKRVVRLRKGEVRVDENRRISGQIHIGRGQDSDPVRADESDGLALGAIFVLAASGPLGEQLTILYPAQRLSNSRPCRTECAGQAGSISS